jgi:fructose-bisphosphate aldolase class 1
MIVKKGKDYMDLDKLLQEIEKQRKEMTLIGIEKGLNDLNTLRISQELDELLNRLNREKTKSGSVN